MKLLGALLVAIVFAVAEGQPGPVVPAAGAPICYDCLGQVVYLGSYFFDGCNFCQCRPPGAPASCDTYRRCEFNVCRFFGPAGPP